MSRTHVTQRITSPLCKIIVTTLCCLTPNMTRSEEELKALVKRAAKAKSDHVTLSVFEAMRVATVATCQLSLLRRVMIVCCAADDNTQHPPTPATTAIVVSWSCCHPLSHPFILGAIIKGIQTDTSISCSKTDGRIGHLHGSLAVLQNNKESETVSFVHLFFLFPICRDRTTNKI